MNRDKLLLAIFGKVPEVPPSNKALEDALSVLTWRERFVVELRYSSYPLSPKVIGHIYPWEHPKNVGGIGVSKTRIEQVAKRALEKLSMPECKKMLQTYDKDQS